MLSDHYKSWISFQQFQGKIFQNFKVLKRLNGEAARLMSEVLNEITMSLVLSKYWQNEDSKNDQHCHSVDSQDKSLE